MNLELPSEKHKKEYNDMIKKWGEYEDINETSPGALFKGNTFEDFLKYNNNAIDNSETGVNAHLFFLTESEKILGALQIRHNLGNDILKEKGGHIGYGIAPEHRGNGYANTMLELGLIESTKLGIEKILITCAIDNIASEKVIIKNGGQFERLSSDGEYKRFLVKNNNN